MEKGTVDFYDHIADIGESIKINNPSGIKRLAYSVGHLLLRMSGERAEQEEGSAKLHTDVDYLKIRNEAVTLAVSAQDKKIQKLESGQIRYWVGKQMLSEHRYFSMMMTMGGAQSGCQDVASDIIKLFDPVAGRREFFLGYDEPTISELIRSTDEAPFVRQVDNQTAKWIHGWLADATRQLDR